MISNSGLKKIIGWTVVAVVILVFLFFFKFNVDRDSVSDLSPSPANKVEEFSADDSLSGFPTEQDLPLPESSVVIRNYRATSPQGQIQLTKILESPRSVRENFNYFRNFLTDTETNWEILVEEIAEDNFSSAYILAKNQNGLLNIGISSDSNGSKSTIDLSFLLNN